MTYGVIVDIRGKEFERNVLLYKLENLRVNIKINEKTFAGVVGDKKK